MAQLPYEIEVEAGDYYKHRRPDRDLLDELIDNYNLLIRYLQEQEDK